MTILKFNLKTFLIPVFAISIFFISCKDKETTEEAAPAAVQEATLEQKKQALQNVAPPANTRTTTNTAGGINPAHGQPGHRCDIPVGAPLNAAAGSANKAPAINSSNAVPVSTPASGSGINPPHGQPGHRCDIKVGDPL
ncbi:MULTISPECIES: hypothetical protein [Aequorivita]|uniref:Uncharacterized protein n=2 Tax=Aequorivita TaxID=153265 RepID=A0AB35YW27_9FLAO|nr:hypothetical protein [Aequorivita sp. Ant34-E75]WGF93678.1 hypothetical protein QCQ61_05675 [Aequorivita sp. Ant34-E75]